MNCPHLGDERWGGKLWWFHGDGKPIISMQSGARSGKERALAEISELMGSCGAVASKHNRQERLSWSLVTTLPFYVWGQTEAWLWLCIPTAQIPTHSGCWGSQDTGKLPTSSPYLFYYKISSLFTSTFNWLNSFFNHKCSLAFLLTDELREEELSHGQDAGFGIRTRFNCHLPVVAAWGSHWNSESLSGFIHNRWEIKPTCWTTAGVCGAHSWYQGPALCPSHLMGCCYILYQERQAERLFHFQPQCLLPRWYP